MFQGARCPFEKLVTRGRELRRILGSGLGFGTRNESPSAGILDEGPTDSDMRSTTWFETMAAHLYLLAINFKAAATLNSRSDRTLLSSLPLKPSSYRMGAAIESTAATHLVREPRDCWNPCAHIGWSMQVVRWSSRDASLRGAEGGGQLCSVSLFGGRRQCPNLSVQCRVGSSWQAAGPSRPRGPPGACAAARRRYCSWGSHRPGTDRGVLLERKSCGGAGTGMSRLLRCTSLPVLFRWRERGSRREKLLGGDTYDARWPGRLPRASSWASHPLCICRRPCGLGHLQK